MFLQNFLQDFVNLFYPRSCLLCGSPLYSDNKYLCTKCMLDMPVTNFHNRENSLTDHLFWGKINLEFAYSYLYFYKGSKYRNLIHMLKYKNKPGIGVFLGELYASELLKNEQVLSADFIVPVPLHPKKQRMRGYNQSEKFAEGLSNILKIPVGNFLKRKVFTETQTKKTKEERWENVKDVFEVSDCNKLKNKHIVVVDDIITTGATVEACLNALKKCEGIKLSVLTIGIAQ